jgi:hypothetical protein
MSATISAITEKVISVPNWGAIGAFAVILIVMILAMLLIGKSR